MILYTVPLVNSHKGTSLSPKSREIRQKWLAPNFSSKCQKDAQEWEYSSADINWNTTPSTTENTQGAG